MKEKFSQNALIHIIFLLIVSGFQVSCGGGSSSNSSSIGHSNSNISHSNSSDGISSSVQFTTSFPGLNKLSELTSKLNKIASVELTIKTVSDGTTITENTMLIETPTASGIWQTMVDNVPFETGIHIVAKAYDNDGVALFSSTSIKHLQTGSNEGIVLHMKAIESHEVSWRSIALRVEKEFSDNQPGGEGFQIMHRMVRSYLHPEYAYAIQDVAGPWQSRDSGTTWQKSKAQGLITQYGQSIEVDPFNPGKVLAITLYPWDQIMDTHAGIYLSEDFADNWKPVLNYDDPDGEYADPDLAYNEGEDNSRIGFDWGLHRFNNANLIYDMASTNNLSQEASVWYAAFHDAALFRSNDGGETWTNVFDLQGHIAVYFVQPHLSDGQTVYLGTSEGLFKSDDNGEHFQPMGNIPAVVNVADDDIPDGNILIRNNVFTSIALNPDNPADIYVVQAVLHHQQPTYGIQTLGVGLFHSLDGGITFSKVELTADKFDGFFNAGRATEFNRTQYVYRHPGSPEKIYISGNPHTFTTDNAGVTWHRMDVAESFPGFGRDVGDGHRRMRRALMAFDPQNPNDALFHANASFWRTDDGGTSVHETSTGFTGIAWGYSLRTAEFDRFDSDRFAFFNHDIGMKITESGANWFFDGTNVSGDRNVWDTRHQGTNTGTFQPINGSKTIVSTVGLYQDNRLMRSEDNGFTWNVTDLDQRHYWFVSFHPQDPMLVYASNKISNDAGQTWNTITWPDPFPGYHVNAVNNPRIMGMCGSNGDTIYATNGFYQFVLRSDDRGQTWQLYWEPGWQFMNPEGIPLLEVDPLNCDRIYVHHKPSGNIATYDGGEHDDFEILDVLSSIPNNPAGNHVKVLTVDPRYPQILYAGTLYPGLPCVFRSTDYGQSWVDITDNMPMTGMLSSSMRVNPHSSELFRGGPFGTWIHTPPNEILEPYSPP